MTTVAEIALGVLVVLAITALTGWFVAQEFGYTAVDRSRLKSRAAAGDTSAARALGITRRTSFMLSGAQLGITVTGLLVGYVAEPLIGDGIGELLGVAGVPAGAGLVVGTVLALLFATVVQMVFGELFPKNLAIARPEQVALGLALSTSLYLRLAGWLVALFDRASELLLRALRIEPVHDLEHAATPRDLEAIIDESRDRGDLPAELSTLLDRVLDFSDRTARAAMVPRTQVTTVSAETTVADLVGLMAAGPSRLPVLADGADDVVGVVCLRDVLALEGADLAAVPVADIARPAVLVPASLPLPGVLAALREAGDELACVVDEYGGLAGVITVEDVGEELVGEITDEHDTGEADPTVGDGEWTVPGALHIDEVERLLGHDLPAGDFQTIGGFVMNELQRLPAEGDTVTVTLPDPSGDAPPRRLLVTVRTLERRVPSTVRLAFEETPAGTPAKVAS
ncbi:MAG TPA: hemolysin family protein [Pseudonocardia sp.]|nr:hemolysin family protein [Pseudonocardia sp.]